jgi:hypothetical protein
VYRYGERFVVRILIRNTGDDLLTLPWSPVVDSVVLAPDESLLSIGLALHGEADNGRRLTVRLPFLYGSMSDLGSLNSIGPGESSEIIAAGVFEGELADDETHVGQVRDLIMRASLTWLFASGGKNYYPIESEAGPAVRLVSRRDGR